MKNDKKNIANNKTFNISILITIVILFLISGIIVYFKTRPEKTYTVIHLLDADKFYVDFNRNNKPDMDELVKLSGVNSLKPKFYNYLDDQLNYIGIDKASGVLVGNLANKYAEHNLLYKDVKVKFVKEKPDNDKYEYRFAKVFLNDNDWGITLLANGYATVYRDSVNFRYYIKHENTYKIKENAKQELAKNYVLVNLKTEKYHKLNCKYGQAVKDFILIRYDELPNFYKKCNFCFSGNKKEDLKLANQSFKNFDISSGSVSMYFTDFTKHLKPSNELYDENSRTLVKLIANAKNTIDIAAYGVDDNKIIVRALENAKKRGVKIRIVADKNAKGETPYKTKIVEQKIGKVVYDNIEYTDANKQNKTKTKFKNYLMHNKFLVFDNSIVYTGSLNIARNDLSGYNSNVSIVIKSPKIAELYTKEFEQMYNGKFHNLKKEIPDNENLKIDNNNTISVYFSPQDNTINTKIIPLINKATKYVYVPIFAFTNKDMIFALESAYRRGVDVKVITDAANAHGDRFAVAKLRDKGIPVKVENYAGKMHMKAIIIDDKYVIAGSMNFSKSGEAHNDENAVIIENPVLASNFKNQFLYIFSKIDNRWLKQSPSAESKNSIGSCEDGVDNDFDGTTDMEDSGCQIKAKR